MTDKYMTRSGKEHLLKDQEAKRSAESQMQAAREISITLSGSLEKEVGKLYHVLGALNESTQRFCHVADEQGKALENRVEHLTEALNNASKSSAMVGWGLIVIGIAAVIVTWLTSGGS